MIRTASAWLTCLALLIGPTASYAQTGAASTAPTTTAATEHPSIQKIPLVTLQLEDTPLQQALRLLFNNTGTSFVLADDLPNPKLTLDIKNQDLVDALRLLLQAGSSPQVRVSYSIVRGVYHIQTFHSQESPIPDGWTLVNPISPQLVSPQSALLAAKKIPLRYVDSEAALAAVRSFLPPNSGVYVTASPNDNSLLFGWPESDGPILVKQKLLTPMQVLSAVDVPPVPIAVTATVVRMDSLGRKKTLLSTVIRTLQNQAAITEEGTSGASAARLHVEVRPRKAGGDMFFVHNSWVVSLPLTMAGSHGGIVRLEKRLTTDTNLRSGEVVTVGEVSGEQWGGSGRILLQLSAATATTK